MEKTQKQESRQSKKVKFIVVREFSGEKTMQENGWNARQAEGIC